jgi:hypothetical protein
MAIRKVEITESQMEKDVRDFAEVLSAQPKRKVKLHMPYEEFVRLSQLEKAGKPANWPYELVSVNGHNFYITLGKECEVPESVYEVLQTAHLV